jgi:type VI secretion system protein VasG
MTKLCADPARLPDPDDLMEKLRPTLLRAFKPAFLGRAIVVPYYPIGDESMRRIIELQLGRIRMRLQENNRVRFTYDDALVAEIGRRCTEVESGARNVDHILTRTLLPEISREYLARMASEASISRVHVSVDEGGSFGYQID